MRKTLKIKLVLAAVLSCFFIIPVIAQSSSESAESEKPVWDHGDNVSNISYRNVRVYSVLESQDAYVVLYEKKGTKIGKVTIPKKWGKTFPRTLEMRKCPKSVPPYMTVLYKDGSFFKVWLTLPVSKQDSVWGVVPNGYDVGSTDIESLEMEW